MRYISLDFTKVLTWEETFGDYEFGEQGREKIGFGSNNKSDTNPTSVCGEYYSDDKLREEVAFYSGDSMAMGGDRVLVLADKPWAFKDDTDCHIVGYEEYLQGNHEPRISGFVGETGAADEDPKPLKVRDDTHDGHEYEVDRTTGHAGYKQYYWHIYRLSVNEGQAYAALTIEASATTPKTDTTLKGSCPTCGH